MDPLILALPVGLFGFVLRLVPRLGTPYAYSSDTYFHLFFAREIRARSLRIPPRMDRILLPHENTYPFGYHLLLAALPERARSWAERLTGAVADAAGTALAFVFAVQALPATSPAHAPGLVAALFALAPGFLRLASGPRAYWGSPRPVGQLLYLIHAVGAFLALGSGHWGWLAGSVLAGAAIVITSKFSVQAMIFFAVGFGTFVDGRYLALAGASVVLALLVSGSRGLRVLVGHYKHSQFYFIHLQKVFVQRHVRTLRDYARATRNAWGALSKAQWRPIVHWLLGETFPPHVFLFIFMPFAIVLARATVRPPLSGLEHFLLTWSATAAVCFVATRWRPLMFLGDGERYLEYALLPTIVLTCLWVDAVWAWLLLAFSAAAAVYFSWSARRLSRTWHDQYLASAEGFRHLDRLPRATVMPLGSFHWQVLFRSGHDVLTIGGNIDADLLSLEEFRLVYGNFPYPSRDFQEIVRRFSVRYVVTDAPHLAHYTRSILGDEEPLLANARRLSDAGGVLVLELPQP